MRQLTLTNMQFEVLHDIVKDAIDELKCDSGEQTSPYKMVRKTETYKIYNQLSTLIPEELTAKLNNLESPKVTITPQELEGDISTVTDDDYGDKVDTLVSNMVASDDNEFTHDSEGC